MRLPETPPARQWWEHPNIAELLVKSLNPAGREFLQKINSRYRYWDEVKRLSGPGNLTGEDLWTAVKYSRATNQKILPLHDPQGRQFTYWLPESLLQVLHEVDQGAGGTVLLGNEEANFVNETKDQIIISSLMEEAIATSQIEGAITTRDQAKEMLRSNRRPKNKSEQMVLNSYRTIRMLREVVNEPLSIELLHKVQREITVDTLDDPSEAGKFRTSKDKIQIWDMSNGEIVYTPPAADLLQERIEKLIAFANTPSTETNFIHPLVKAAVLHFWLAYEHPYTDGNGRTSRALFYWFMLKSKYWLFEYLTISKIVYQAPNQYYRSFLHTEYDSNDLTYSINFMLKVTRSAIKQLRTVLRDKVKENTMVAETLRMFPGINYRQRELLKHALNHRAHLYTVASHQKSHGVSYQTARTDLLGLVQLTLFDLSSSGKQMVFIPARDFAEKLSNKRPNRLAL